ncbi:MAG TPA: LLM class flavin-dependent oxidoreductase [Ramlibacter sp.]|jgi:alkanesulfonate monooxygenase SsuD/methylene tetrahydromethanopterin reductase-like flavin-dependent oxidoreductase (luciferase family)|nr:LLM class flavin-dependent oxidoreductase [Ramlibacter sp.]
MKVILFHLMSYSDLDFEATKSYETVWVNLPNKFFDPAKGTALYNRYIDELISAEPLGFDGVAVNEHHQTAYGLMPSPTVIASILARQTKRVKIAILGNALPLRSHPMTIAEEHAMIDVISGGRLISGFVRGIGAEYHTFGLNPTISHDRFHEAHDLIVQAWTKPGPFAFTGKHYNVEYVNLWPKPVQQPHPPIWVPSQGSKETIDWAAAPEHRYTYLQTFSPVKVVERYLKSYRDTAAGFGYEAEDSQLGWAVPVYVADSDEQARREAKEPFELFRNRLLKMPFEMLLPPGYSSRNSLKGMMAAKAALTQDMTIDFAIDNGMIICGSPDTVREKITDYWKTMCFGNLLTMMHFGTLSPELTKRSMELFAAKVLPAVQALSAETRPVAA